MSCPCGRRSSIRAEFLQSKRSSHSAESSLLFFWVPENILELDPYHMTMAFHDVDGSSAGERPGIILEPSGEYVFNIEQVRIRGVHVVLQLSRTASALIWSPSGGGEC